MNIQNKIISFFLRHPEYFRIIIASSYAFSHEQLTKYRDFYDWNRISSNKNIPWDKQILGTFSDKLAWDYISTNPGAFKDLSLVDEFVDFIQWEEHPVASGVTIASNTGLPWSVEFIKKYEAKLFFNELSENESLPWSEQLIDTYSDRWDIQSLSNNNALPWSLSFFEKHLSQFLSVQSPFAINEALYGIFEIVDKHHFLLDWYSIWSNPKLPWIEKDLLNYWEEHINWRYIACNEYLLKNPEFFEMHLDKWLDKSNNAFYTLSSNKSLPWNPKFIERFADRWDWEMLGANEGLPWSIEFIDRYADFLPWGWYEEYVSKENMNQNNKAPITLGSYHSGIVTNKGLPWSIDFLLYYEDKVDTEMLWLNPAVWEKAFMPYVDEKIIDTVVRII